MVIYVDMLILINFAADYFLLKATAAVMKAAAPLWRILVAAFLASLFSLYIFLPAQSVFLQIVLRLAFCLLIVLCAFGVRSKSFFIKACLLFLGVTFAFAGAMTAVYSVFKPDKMAVKNSVVYFDISPLALIISSAAFYLVLQVAGITFSRRASAVALKVSLISGEREKTLSGFADTGNNLRDPFSDSPVIIVNESDIKSLFEEGGDKSRFCLLPCGTVTGTALLNGYRLDKAVIKTDKKEYSLIKPIAAFSAAPIEKNTAIINPDSLQ